jgi:hypothetical protein
MGLLVWMCWFIIVQRVYLTPGLYNRDFLFGELMARRRFVLMTGGRSPVSFNQPNELRSPSNYASARRFVYCVDRCSNRRFGGDRDFRLLNCDRPPVAPYQRCPPWHAACLITGCCCVLLGAWWFLPSGVRAPVRAEDWPGLFRVQGLKNDI